MTKTKFKDLPVGDYFFFPLSCVPHHKVSESHSVEAGSAYNRPTDPNERVLHIRYTEDGRLKIGIYSLPLKLAALPSPEDFDRMNKAASYEDQQLAFERGQKKPSGV